MSEWITVARAEEVGLGGRRVIDVDDAQIVVFNHDGQYYAIEDVCTHGGGQLTGGTVEGDQIVCQRHGARFCICSGPALSAPAPVTIAPNPTPLDESHTCNNLSYRLVQNIGQATRTPAT